MNNLVSIGQAAKITGLSAKTIRFYEEIKLLSPAKRLDNSYRTYSQEDLQILFLIKEARSLGLPLKDIKAVVHLCLSEGCESARNLLKTKLPVYLEEIEVKIRELKDIQAKLRSYKESSITPGLKGKCLICKDIGRG
ncbi:MAG: MerR family transcriptional regulator [Patescibacteria group bacterium]|nr:MerR family transcriptional regulator [Patescibacteria group bacterium]